jgi:hypothetical protein
VAAVAAVNGVGRIQSEAFDSEKKLKVRAEYSLLTSLSFNCGAGATELDEQIGDISQPPGSGRNSRACHHLLGGEKARSTAKYRAISRHAKAAPNIGETDCFLARPLAMTLDQIEGRCFDFIL